MRPMSRRNNGRRSHRASQSLSQEEDGERTREGAAGERVVFSTCGLVPTVAEGKRPPSSTPGAAQADRQQQLDTRHVCSLDRGGQIQQGQGYGKSRRCPLHTQGKVGTSLQALQDVSRRVRPLQSLSGTVPRWMRPPGGVRLRIRCAACEEHSTRQCHRCQSGRDARDGPSAGVHMVQGARELHQNGCPPYAGARRRLVVHSAGAIRAEVQAGGSCTDWYNPQSQPPG